MKPTIRDTARSMVRAALRMKGVHATKENTTKLVNDLLASKHLPRVEKEHKRRAKAMAKLVKENLLTATKWSPT